MKFSRRYRLPGIVVIAALVGSLSGIAAAQDPPAITDQGASTIYYNGVHISGTLTSTDTLFATLNYGPVDEPQVNLTAGGFDNPPGTDVPIAVVLSQLKPNTAYSYQWIIYDDAANSVITSPSATFTTTGPPEGPPNPLVPPANPKANGIYGGCGSDDECVADMNGVRADQENLQPITLPTNWASLAAAEQIFVFTNLERVSRGVAPIPNLVNTYDDQIQKGINIDNDPQLPPGTDFSASGTIWAGYPSVLGAFVVWMYYDGPGGADPDCTGPSDGCWGHRDNILNADWNATDAGAGTDPRGNKGQAALFWIDPDAPAAENVVLTWADELQYLSS